MNATGLGAAKYEQIITLTTVVTLGLGLLAFLQQMPVDIPLPFAPGAPGVGVYWLLSAGLVVTASVGADVITRSYPGIQQSERLWARIGSLRFRTAPRYWILPALSVLGFELFFRMTSSGLVLYVSAAFAAIVFGGIMVAQYHSLNQADPYYRLAMFGLNLAIYLVGFISFTAIYVNKVRSVVSATLVLAIAALLMFELLHGTQQPVKRVAIYSVVCGLVLGQVTWALNYWPATAMAGGLFLLAVFHGLGGMVSSYLKGDLRLRSAAEFGMVSVLGLCLATYITFGMR